MLSDQLKQRFTDRNRILDQIEELQELLASDERYITADLIEEGYRVLPHRYSISILSEENSDFMDRENIKKGVSFLLQRSKQSITAHKNYTKELSDAVHDTEGFTIATDGEDRITTVFYYRVSNVMVHTSGGHLIMGDRVEVTDAEWEDILKAKIPEHLLYDSYKGQIE